MAKREFKQIKNTWAKKLFGDEGPDLVIANAGRILNWVGL